MEEATWPVDAASASLAPLTFTLPHDFREVRIGEFMERPASFYAVHHHRVTIGYADATGAVTTRPITAIEVIACNHQQYISGFCHVRLEMRTFRLNRIAFMIRAGSAERVDANVEVLRWLLEGC